MYSSQIALLIAFWGAGLPVIMKPGNRIATNPDGVIVNANLYFFSWLSFGACLFLSGSLMQESAGIDVTKTPPKTARWFGLAAASLVVMGASARLFKNECNGNFSVASFNADGQGHDPASKYCTRCKLGISIGVIGFVIALVMTYLSKLGLTVLIELVVSTILLAMWCFGVGYITFGTAPGSFIGNLYFACWICFILCVFLFAQGFREFMSGRLEGHDNQGEEGETDSEQPHKAPQVPEEDDI